MITNRMTSAITRIERARGFLEAAHLSPEWIREMGFGAGMGLPNIKRNADLLDIDSRIGEGTKVSAEVLMDGPGGTG